jgi:pimeloyl-ACP methyl ester carboxylesterase
MERPVNAALRIPVEGGALAVGIRGPEDAAPVVAIHGVTSSQLAWQWLARELSDAQVIAPDLRGRGRSRELPGPYGLRRHAADLVRVIDTLNIDRLPVVGHSMGAFVAVLLAAARPETVSSLVLVDGGFPLHRPTGVSDADLPSAVLGPAAERLGMTFPDREAYRDFWRAHPAFAGNWSPALQAYADYDLVDDGMLRPASRLEAVSIDALELYGPDWYLDALRALHMPVTVFRAPRGLQNEPGGLYPPGELESAASLVPHLRVVEVDDVNHYTVVMGEHGARIVAGAVRAAYSPRPERLAKEPT